MPIDNKNKGAQAAAVDERLRELESRLATPIGEEERFRIRTAIVLEQLARQAQQQDDRLDAIVEFRRELENRLGRIEEALVELKEWRNRTDARLDQGGETLAAMRGALGMQEGGTPRNGGNGNGGAPSWLTEGVVQSSLKILGWLVGGLVLLAAGEQALKFIIGPGQ
ncbi:MAG: hypothetical protein ACU85V_00260 [Gammaproteobacteria bacterium]